MLEFCVWQAPKLHATLDLSQKTEKPQLHNTVGAFENVLKTGDISSKSAFSGNRVPPLANRIEEQGLSAVSETP